jgi:hypothetical protein
MVNYRNNEFSVDITNDSIKLERPPNHVPLTRERFEYIVSKQSEWRDAFLRQKKQEKRDKHNTEFLRNQRRKWVLANKPPKYSNKGRPRKNTIVNIVTENAVESTETA